MASTKPARARRSSAATTPHKPFEPSDDSPIVEVPGYGPLTAKQRAFAEAYRRHGNGTRAAREAGYGTNDHLLSSIAAQLRRNPRVAWYLSFLGRNDDLQPGDVIDRLRDLAVTADHAGAAVRATELLGKTKGMFADDVNLHVSRSSDEELAAVIAGDDLALKETILRRLRGE